MNKRLNFSFSSNLWLKAGLLITVFVFTYIGAISLLVNTWLGRDYYSHGFLIPFISLYFIYAKRERLKQLSIQPKISGGLFLTLTGCLLLIAGNVSSAAIVQQFSFLVIIPGLVLMLLGTRYLKALSLPLAYLIFMVPVLDVVIDIDRLHWPSQIFSAKIASGILHFINIPVLLDAQYLQLPDITLEISNQCSGIRYLISILALGIPLAYFTQKTLWRKIALISFGIIIGVLANGVRVALIGIWAYRGGEILHGPLHIFQGLFVSVVGFISLFIIAGILSRIPSQNYSHHLNNPSIDTETRADFLTSNLKQFNRAWVIAIVILLSVGGYIHLYKTKPVPLNASLKEMPLTIADWKGMTISDYNNNPFVIQGADSEIIRRYRNSSGREVKLYIGYFESQSQGKELIHYSLEKLYDTSKKIEVPIGTDTSIEVNKTMLMNDSKTLLALYWYDLNGQIIADRYRVKLMTAFDGLIHRRTNGAAVIVYSSLNSADKVDDVLKDEIKFIQQLFPVLDNYLP